MLLPATLEVLDHRRNLLAFSGGVDSSALFFLLLERNTPFDIAIVNYQTREQSQKEVAYAQKLAQQYGKKCFLLEVSLSETNFEAAARKQRYTFFESLITAHKYDNLITAHQLDDRLEWLLMQLSKGAGLYELLGSQPIETREDYRLVRPLLESSRADILTYLQKNSITYFEDESNLDPRYKRNFFRHNISGPLIEKYAQGIQKSFQYLNEDLQSVMEAKPTFIQIEDLFYFPMTNSRRSAILTVDKLLKAEGFLMRRGDREALKSADEHVVGRRYVVSFHHDYCFVTPYVTAEMSKPFKEQCRLLKIPQKMRPYLFLNNTVFEKVALLLQPS